LRSKSRRLARLTRRKRFRDPHPIRSRQGAPDPALPVRIPHIVLAEFV